MAESDPQPSPALLAGLRKALSGPRLLQGDGDEPLFPKGAAGKRLAQTAIQQELLVTKKRTVKVDGKIRRLEEGELTEKGRQLVVQTDDLKPVLEALLPAAQALAASRTGGPNTEPFRQAMEQATALWGETIRDAIDTLQQSIVDGFRTLEQSVVTTVSAPIPGPVVEAGPMLAALAVALDRVSAPAAAPRAGASAEPLDNAVVAAVEDYAREKGGGCPFDVLMSRLRTTHPDLSLGAFHDGLRRLHEAGRVRLSGWPKMLDEIPEPELALFISSKVMYYANPAQQHG